MGADDRTSEAASSHRVELTRAAWGMLLLTRPSAAARVLDGRRPHPGGELSVLRLLGLRHVTQAVVTAARPSPEVVIAGAGLDVLHALTAVGYGVSRRTRRRPGLLDALVASGFAVATTLFTPMSETGRDASAGQRGQSNSTERKAAAAAAMAALVAGGWWLRSRSPLARSAETERASGPAEPGTLRYKVPDHQDPAVLLAALDIEGFAAEPDWVSGEHHLTIFCDDLREDRPRVRSVLEHTTASSFSGPDIIHVPVLFEDEDSLHGV